MRRYGTPTTRRDLEEKRNWTKSGNSRISRAEDVVKQVCELTYNIPGAEWVPVSPGFTDVFSVISAPDSGCRGLKPVAVIAEKNALISENSNSTDVVIYTSGSAVHPLGVLGSHRVCRCAEPFKKPAGLFQLILAA